MVRHSRQRGLTLTEIAVVLVIVGLFIGGALKGQQMITNAKVARIESDFRNITSAILAYQDRYGVLPGDDPAASTRFVGNWSAADNGNGNGVIAGPWNSTNNTQESRKIWKHLRGAGFLKGPVDTTSAAYQQPAHAYGGQIGFEQGIYNLHGPVVVFGALPGTITQVLEARGDDGVPKSGAVQGNATATAYEPARRYDLAYGF